MKTYSNSGKAKSPKKERIIYSIVAVASIAIIALSVTMAAVFSGNEDLPVSAPDAVTPDDTGNNPPSDEPVEDTGSGEIKFFVPVSDTTVIRAASLETLVYMPSLNMWKTHAGVDLAAQENATVSAVADGTVTAVEETTLEGIVVSVQHENGLTSVYKSLASSLVSVGDSVSGGSAIGTAGTMLTESSDGVHLHLEMSVNGDLVDPLSYIDLEIIK